VLFNPPIVDIVRTHRVLHRKQWGNLVVLENHLSFSVDNEADIKEAILEVGVTRLGLGHDERVVLSRNLPQFFGFFARYVNRAFTRELDVVKIEHFVVERLQSSLWEGDQPHGDIESRQPTGSLDQVLQMIEVDLNVFAAADSANGRDEANGGIRF